MEKTNLNEGKAGGRGETDWHIWLIITLKLQKLLSSVPRAVWQIMLPNYTAELSPARGEWESQCKCWTRCPFRDSLIFGGISHGIRTAQGCAKSFSTPNNRYNHILWWPRCREICFPNKTDTTRPLFLRALHKHCKQQKSNYIKFSASKLPKSEKNKGQSYTELGQWQWARLLQVLKSLRTGKSQQFIFSGGGGGSHLWLKFDRELALKVALDTRNSQPSFLPSAFPRRWSQAAIKQLQHH